MQRMSDCLNKKVSISAHFIVSDIDGIKLLLPKEVFLIKYQVSTQQFGAMTSEKNDKGCPISFDSSLICIVASHLACAEIENVMFFCI